MKFKISLSEKVLLSIGSLITLALVAVLYISRTMVMTSFSRLEAMEVRADVERARKGVEVELENLTSICGDWAPRDDTRNFMLGTSADYNASTLTVDALANLNLNFMIFVDTSGRIFHVAAVDIEKGAFVQAPQSLTDRILAAKSLLDINDPAKSISGLIILPEEVALVAAQPISNSLSQGPISGTLIIGRFLNDNLIKAISDKMILDISMTYSNSPAESPDFAHDPDLSRDKNIVVRILDRGNAAGLTNIYDIDGSKYITLKVNVPRVIYNNGLKTVHYFTAAVALTVIIMLVALLLVMQKIVLRPINTLTKNFINIGSGYGGGTRPYTERGDEIGSLARSFDLVMKNLRRRMSDLNESEKRFEEVAENSGDWIWEVNAEGLYTYSSTVVEKLLGYKPEEIVGKKYFYDFFATDRKKELKTAALEAFAKKEKLSGIIQNIRKDGRAVVLETHGTPIVDDEGNLHGYRGADRDITESKKAQEKIVQTLSLLTATLESTADGILVVDVNGMVVSYNQKFQQMWRIPDELIESKDDSELLAFVLDQLADPEVFLAEVRRLYASTKEESSDLLKFKDGRVFERFSKPQNVEGRIVGRVWSFRDVTERERAEERITAVNDLQKLLLPPVPIEQKLKLVTDAVVRILDADFARVWTIMPGDRCEAGCIHAEAKEGPHVCRFRDKCLHLMASSGRYTHIDGKVHRRVPFGCYKIGLIAAGEQDKFLTNDAATDPQVHNHNWVKELGLVSFAGYRLMHTDGTPLGVLALFSKHPISPEEDAILEGIAHSTSMVIHTSHAEEALRHEKDFAESLTETAQVIMLVLDTNAHIVSLNPYMEEISGYKLEEVKGKDWFDAFLPKADRSQIKERFKQAIGDIQTKGVANPIIAKDGHEVLIEWYDKTLKDKDGRAVGLIAIGQDITERRKTEDALRENEEFTRRVIESSNDCIKVLDLEGRLLSMSCGGQRMLELDDASMFLNSSFIDFWKGKEREGCLEAISKAKQGGAGVFYGNMKTIKGTPKSFEIVVTPIKDANGGITSLLAVSRDITERKKTEEIVANLNKDLKSTVAQLTQSNKQLQEFAHLAAHDLKTPLRGIGTLAQWLVHDYREKFDSEGRRQVDLLVEKVEQTNDLVNAILQYSTITRERDKEIPIDINSLVGTILLEIRTPPNIEITINKNLPVVICRESHIRLVFYHLLTNAVKFIDKPEGQITIDCADKSDCWEFSVSDNGPGIAPQHFERVFQFFQTLGNDSDQNVGAGMGLTISRKIIGLYGGKIWLTSELGMGSTFFFTLPKSPIAANSEKLLLASS